MFFKAPTTLKSLGPLLRQTREKESLSISEVACLARLSETEIIKIESEQTTLSSIDRFHAVAYARILGIDPLAIRDSLPPMPKLLPKGRQHTLNYIRLLRRSPFRLQWQLFSSLAPLGRLVMYLLITITFFSIWGMIREFARIRDIPWVTTTKTLPHFSI